MTVNKNQLMQVNFNIPSIPTVKKITQIVCKVIFSFVKTKKKIETL